MNIEEYKQKEKLANELRLLIIKEFINDLDFHQIIDETDKIKFLDVANLLYGEIE
jgi:hypothetical protein